MAFQPPRTTLPVLLERLAATTASSRFQTGQPSITATAHFNRASTISIRPWSTRWTKFSGHLRATPPSGAAPGLSDNCKNYGNTSANGVGAADLFRYSAPAARSYISQGNGTPAY